MTREKAIIKEKQYAEKRFTQLLAQVDQIDSNATEEQIQIKLNELDTQWRNFCKNLIYLKACGEDEFLKVAMERAFKTLKITQ